MDLRLSELEGWLAAHEGKVEHDLGHSGVAPLLDYGELPAPRELVRAIARRHGVPEREVVVTNGASEAAFLASAALLEPGDVAAVESPTYPPLADAPRLVGARVERFPRRFEDGFEVRATPARAALVVLTSPHNPSGCRVPAATIAMIAEATGGHVLVDEIFREIADDPAPSARHAHPRALASGSLTKAFGLPGLRVGWLLAPADVAERARAAKNVVSLASGALDQALAARALATDLGERAARRRRENLLLVEEAIRRARLAWVRPEAGVSCVVKVAGDDRAVAERLLARGVLVVPGSALGCPGTIRVGFGGEREAVQRALEAFVAALGPSGG